MIGGQTMMMGTVRKIAVLLLASYALQVLAVHVATSVPTKTKTIPLANGKEVKVESYVSGVDRGYSLIPAVGMLAFAPYGTRGGVISYGNDRHLFEAEIADDIDWDSFRATLGEDGSVTVEGTVEVETRVRCRFPFAR